MSCYNCCTGVSLTSQLLLTRGKHADRHRDKSEHRFALQSAIRGDSEQGHFQDIGHTPWEVGGQPEPPGLRAQAPEGLPWLHTSSVLSDLPAVCTCLKVRGPARTVPKQTTWHPEQAGGEGVGVGEPSPADPGEAVHIFRM